MPELIVAIAVPRFRLRRSGSAFPAGADHDLDREVKS